MNWIKQHGWKALGVFLVIHTLVEGFLGPVPRLNILHETIRNLYFHVTMWFAMMAILTVSLIKSLSYLNQFNLEQDRWAAASAKVGILLGVLGVITGSVWARFTWGDWWANDPKLNGAAITLLFYFAYQLLRSSIDDEAKRARVSAIYNIFAYVMLVVFLMIMPRMYPSLHPGQSGNPGFNQYDLDNNMRRVFYPAIIGWILLAWWMVTLEVRTRKAEATLI
jgi:heme exporter protein C